MRVLIVDDEKIIRDGLCAMIPWQELGFRFPDTAENGANALERMETTAYDVMITDVRMPAMDGLTLCQKAHSLYPDCVIIILSGYGDFQYAQTAMEFGVRRYLLKPVDENKLIEFLLQIRKEHGKKQKGTEPGPGAQFYDCVLPFTPNTKQIWISDADAGKAMVRALVKGEMAEVTDILERFIWKLASAKLPYEQRIACCDTFLVSLKKLVKNLKLEEATRLNDHAEDHPIYHATNLVQLYESLLAVVGQMDGHLRARMSEGNARTSDQMTAYIQENYHTRLSTASLAAHFHLSAAYCGRLFKEEQGVSIVQYIHMVRVEQAKRLLEETDYKMEYIALQIGYPEVSSFYSQFKRLVDMTPEQYRKLSAGKRERN